jgi:hypothetical protein
VPDGHPVEFYVDYGFPDGGRVMFRCPHQEQFTTLPNAVWEVRSPDPLTVWPSVHNTLCGCHGFITEGCWVPVGSSS